MEASFTRACSILLTLSGTGIRGRGAAGRNHGSSPRQVFQGKQSRSRGAPSVRVTRTEAEKPAGTGSRLMRSF
jgi:hypothetical protein